MSPKSLLIQTNQIHSIIIFSHLDHQLIHRHILHFVTFRHFVLLLSFLAQKKCTPCLISWTTLTGYTLFHCKYYILPALLFRKCISYKRAVIITCYYYNVSILVTCGFQDRKSSVFFYISFRAGCFCLDQCFFTVLFSSTWIYILNILFLSKVIFTKMSLLFLGIITMTFSFFQIFYDFVIAFFV